MLLISIPAGKPVPEHSHSGRELTVVLSGGFHDVTGEYGPGDIQEAYGDLAVIFVDKEEEMYVEGEKRKGGFRGKKKFEIIKKVKESNVVTSFYLKREDGESVPNFIAGQYVAVTVTIPNTSHKHTRTYSLSDSNDKDYLRISVKKQEGNPDGIVSNYLHSDKTAGDTLILGMPSGEFVIKESEKPLI